MSEPITMSKEQERADRNVADSFPYNDRRARAWAEVDATRAALAASEARCADLAAQVETLKPLARLGLNALDVAWDGCDYDGGEIQEDATAFRAVVAEERTETCGDACRCAGFAEDCGWLCYRESEATTKARAALAATAPKGDANEQAR